MRAVLLFMELWLRLLERRMVVGGKSKFVQELCRYPGDERKIETARQHILEAHAERLSQELRKKVTVEDILQGKAPRPRVLDMFAGGGAIPLEALRLGCEAYALELNPVAHLIELCTLVYPQKFGRPDPDAKGSAKDSTWAGLVEEVEYWGKWVLEKVKEEIGDLYPSIPDPGEHKVSKSVQEAMFGSASQALEDGFLTPVAYLWTRTVPCKNRSCNTTVPLVRQTWLCKKAGRYAALKAAPEVAKNRVCFTVVQSYARTEAEAIREFGLDPGAFSRAGNTACFFCGTVADSGYVKQEGRAGRMGKQLMAVVCAKAGQRGKIYLGTDEVDSNLLPDDDAIQQRIAQLCRETGLTVPKEPLPHYVIGGGGICKPSGFTLWRDIFTQRQMLSLLTFIKWVHCAHQQMLKESYSYEHAQVVVTYLGLWIDKVADYGSANCRWIGQTEAIADTLARQALPMIWDFAEFVPFASAGSNAKSILGSIVDGFDSAIVSSLPAHVSRGTATLLPYESNFFDAIVVDPPYYDNVGYAILSDFFYVWLRRTVGYLYLEHFATELAPKKNEVVADAKRHTGREKARRAYEEMMFQSFKEAFRALKPNAPMVLVYAHKTTAGWTTLVDALRRAGLVVTESWPLQTERRGRLLEIGSAALASSIFLVARKREESATVGDYAQVRSELEEIIRERVETLWSMGISGADLVIACVGAGLKAFTRYQRVELPNGDEVPAERFLSEVEGVVLDTILEKLFGVSRYSVSAVDAPTRFYVLWRYAYGRAEVDAGEAIVFAYPQGVELDGPQGLSLGRNPLLYKKKNKYCLRDFTDRGQDEKLGLSYVETIVSGSRSRRRMAQRASETLSLFEPEELGETAANTLLREASLIDVLHRLLWLMENSTAQVSEFLDQAQPNVEQLRLVTQALAGPALQGGSGRLTTDSESAALQKLIANWRHIVEDNLFRKR
nr:DUF1156 domain-containing protein [Candidatus Hakubella thermalkaliphila]